MIYRLIGGLFWKLYKKYKRKFIPLYYVAFITALVINVIVFYLQDGKFTFDNIFSKIFQVFYIYAFFIFIIFNPTTYISSYVLEEEKIALYLGDTIFTRVEYSKIQKVTLKKLPYENIYLVTIFTKYMRDKYIIILNVEQAEQLYDFIRSKLNNNNRIFTSYVFLKIYGLIFMLYVLLNDLIYHLPLIFLGLLIIVIIFQIIVNIRYKKNSI